MSRTAALHDGGRHKSHKIFVISTMAKDMKKDATDLSIEEKLKNLYQLQTMLSEIDKIKTLRGELPLEVQDLEDEIEGLSTRIEKIHGEIGELNADIATRKANI